ncbi:MAG: hypothetical protein ACM3NT_08450 [Methylocystaceae bacterium]
MSNKLTMFGRLYRRDMERIGVESLGLAGVALITILLGLTPWNKNVIILPLVVVTGVAMVLPIITSLLSLHREWKENTIYLLLSLPVGGSSVLGAKLLAALTQVVINASIVLIMIVACGFELLPKQGIDWTTFWQQVQAFWQYADMSRMLPFIIIMGILLMIYGLSSLQLGVLIGKLFRRFTSVATIGALIAVFWVGSNLLNAMLSLIPAHINWSPGAAPIPTIGLVLPVAFMAIMIGLIFCGSVYVYNHRIEV